MFAIMLIPIKYLWKATPVLYNLSLFLIGLLVKFHDPVMAAATGTKR